MYAIVILLNHVTFIFVSNDYWLECQRSYDGDHSCTLSFFIKELVAVGIYHHQILVIIGIFHHCALIIVAIDHHKDLSLGKLSCFDHDRNRFSLQCNHLRRKAFIKSTIFILSIEIFQKYPSYC